MSAETITREDILEQIDDMTEHLYRVDENARFWREQIDNENLRSLLYDIEQGVQRVMSLVEKLMPPVTPAANTHDLHNYYVDHHTG